MITAKEAKELSEKYKELRKLEKYLIQTIINNKLEDIYVDINKQAKNGYKHCVSTIITNSYISHKYGKDATQNDVSNINNSIINILKELGYTVTLIDGLLLIDW